MSDATLIFGGRDESMGTTADGLKRKLADLERQGKSTAQALSDGTRKASTEMRQIGGQLDEQLKRMGRFRENATKAFAFVTAGQSIASDVAGMRADRTKTFRTQAESDNATRLNFQLAGLSADQAQALTRRAGAAFGGRPFATDATASLHRITDRLGRMPGMPSESMEATLRNATEGLSRFGHIDGYDSSLEALASHKDTGGRADLSTMALALATRSRRMSHTDVQSLMGGLGSGSIGVSDGMMTTSDSNLSAVVAAMNKAGGLRMQEGQAAGASRMAFWGARAETAPDFDRLMQRRGMTTSMGPNGEWIAEGMNAAVPGEAEGWNYRDPGAGPDPERMSDWAKAAANNPLVQMMGTYGALRGGEALIGGYAARQAASRAASAAGGLGANASKVLMDRLTMGNAYRIPQPTVTPKSWAPVAGAVASGAFMALTPSMAGASEEDPSAAYQRRLNGTRSPTQSYSELVMMEQNRLYRDEGMAYDMWVGARDAFNPWADKSIGSHLRPFEKEAEANVQGALRVRPGGELPTMNAEEFAAAMVRALSQAQLSVTVVNQPQPPAVPAAAP